MPKKKTISKSLYERLQQPENYSDREFFAETTRQCLSVFGMFNQNQLRCGVPTKIIFQWAHFGKEPKPIARQNFLDFMLSLEVDSNT